MEEIDCKGLQPIRMQSTVHGLKKKKKSLLPQHHKDRILIQRARQKVLLPGLKGVGWTLCDLRGPVSVALCQITDDHVV